MRTLRYDPAFARSTGRGSDRGLLQHCGGAQVPIRGVLFRVLRQTARAALRTRTSRKVCPGRIGKLSNARIGTRSGYRAWSRIKQRVGLLGNGDIPALGSSFLALIRALVNDFHFYARGTREKNDPRPEAMEIFDLADFACYL